MTIKVKVSNLYPSANSLQALLNIKTNFKFGWDMSKRLKIIQTEIKEIDEHRIKILQELSGGKLAEDGKNFDLGENVVEFQKQYAELLDSEVELNIFPIKATDLSNIQIEGAHIHQLDWLIEQPEAPLDWLIEQPEAPQFEAVN